LGTIQPVTSTLPVGAGIPHDNLTVGEAIERAELLSNVAYKIRLTLDDAPAAATFDSSTEVTFDARHEGAETFINIAARSVDEVVLNGKQLTAGEHEFDGTRLRLRDLHRGANRLHVKALCEYQQTGAGLHRLADPVDGHVYVYTHFEPFDAHKVLACFDQPDLKAHVNMSVTAPTRWRVCSNARVTGTEVHNGHNTTQFNTTPPIPPYLIAVVAGPYHVIESEHLQIPLGIWCRESMLPWVEEQAADVFEITRQGLDFFARYFGLPYPFDEYNQLFVPEFMMGAMENPGCVTFNESYVFRGRPSETQLARRAETILHEMAHVHGFGDVTTMRWWGDLWLNETFATYMANLAMYEATRFKNAWVDFANTVKSVAARQDQLVTTHRIADDIPDTDSVRQNFDGITYHKGAAVLRQLVAWVGDDAFMRGVQDYFRRYKWGNATLDDFLDCLRRSSGRDVSRFAREWLQTTGMNTLRPVDTVKNDRYTSFAVAQTADPAHPTLRSHRIAVGLYDRDARGRLNRRRRVELDIEGPLTRVPDLESERVADLVVVNDGDLTFAKMRFDERSIGTLRGDLSGLDDALTRALCWAALWDMTRDAELAARHFVELVSRHAPSEVELLLVERVLNQAQAAADQFGDPANRPAARSCLHVVAHAELTALAAGSDAQMAWFRCFTTTAGEAEDLDHLAAMLEGNWEVPGVTVDTELRWLLLGQLATVARAGAVAINTEIDRDPTDIGRRRAAACLAARPTPKFKEQAWNRLMKPSAAVPKEWQKAAGGELSLAAEVAIMAGFLVGSVVTGGFMSRGEDPEVLRPYVNRYVESLPVIWETRGVDEAEAFTEYLYPRLFVDDAMLAAIERALEDERLPAAALRILREGRDGTLRARRAQEFDRAAAQATSSSV
jgi:aminopeptidase N